VQPEVLDVVAAHIDQQVIAGERSHRPSATFLADAVRLANQERGAIAWFAAAHRHDHVFDRRWVSVRE
jgi:hypothetical protein